jgi:hypothetical protein
VYRIAPAQEQTPVAIPKHSPTFRLVLLFVLLAILIVILWLL